jgi:hypothetical protein
MHDGPEGVDATDAVMQSLQVLATPPDELVAAGDVERVGAALSELVPELSEGSTRLLDCRLEDLRLRRGRWVGRYLLTLHDERSGTRAVPLTAVVGGERPDGKGTAVPFGTPGWSVYLSELRITMSTWPEDKRLAALPLLTNPASAAALLQDLLRRSWPGLTLATCRPEIVRYRPGQRCTVVCRLGYGPAADTRWPSAVVTKVHRRGEGAQGYGALLALREAGLGRGSGPVVAAPLGSLESRDVFVQGYVGADQDLIGAIRHACAGGAAWDVAARRLSRVAEALAALHATPVHYGPPRTVEDELLSLRASTAKLATVEERIGAALDPLFDLLERSAHATSAEPDVAAHGAFRPAQVRLHGSRVGFLDLDGFCRSEPAQDVGRFIAKLRLLALSPSAPGVADDAAMKGADMLSTVFVSGHRRTAPVSAARIALWETLDLTKSLLQSWSRGRPEGTVAILAALARNVDGSTVRA